MKLALTMIVRDERVHVAEAIASVRGLVSQVVVVDTGSTDDTVARALQAGAQVVHFPWCDDFAAARNAALPSIRADWILALDADERLPSSEHKAIRAALGADFDYGMLPLFNADAPDASCAAVISGQRGANPVLVPRLLRMRPEFRWAGRVHENPEGIGVDPERVRYVPARIAHYGATPAARSELAKNGRNLRLLELRCADEPDNSVPWSYLAEELYAAGRRAEADRIVERAWEVCREAWESPRPGRARPPALRLLLRISMVRLQAGDLDGAEDAVRRVQGWVGDAHPILRFLRGRCRELRADRGPPSDSLGLLLGAAADYRACAQAHGVAYSEQAGAAITGAATCARLVLVLLALDRPRDAATVAEASIRQHGPDVALRCALAQALIANGEPDRALAALDLPPALTNADAHALAARAEHARGHHEAARERVRRAGAADRAGWMEPRRGAALITLAGALGMSVARGPGMIGS